jgi:hypothetical protein
VQGAQHILGPFGIDCDLRRWGLKGGRSDEELAFFIRNGFWREQRGRFHYALHAGKLTVEWLSGTEK